MNSKQRRNNRVFLHEVTLIATDKNYFDFDKRVVLAKGWLQWQTKRKNWTCGPMCYNKQTFKFRNAALATVFALKWS